MRDWIGLVAEGDLSEGVPFVTEIEGTEICVVLVGDEVFGIQNDCPIDGGSLGEGDIEDAVVLTCSGDGTKFDVSTGDALNGSERLEVFEVRTEDGIVQVQLP